MNAWTTVCSFLGSWLLVAGAIYQAALELSEQEVDRAQLDAAASSVRRPDPVSAWWWLLPPVAYFLQRRRSSDHRDAVMKALGPEQLLQTVTFFNKARGWLIVAGGAFLIAVQVTWQLCESFAWPLAVFWILLVAGTAVSIANVVNHTLRSNRLLEGEGEGERRRGGRGRAGRRLEKLSPQLLRGFR